MNARYAVLLLLGVLLAGCANSEPDDDPVNPDAVLDDPDAYYADHFCIKQGVTPRTFAPDYQSDKIQADPWVLGDLWTFSLKINGESLDDVELLYYDDIDANQAGIPAHYMVGDRNAESALVHALFSTDPMLGRIHRILYSPHEGGVHADMFNFPLCEGNTWSTKFYGTDYNLRAQEADVLGSAGAKEPGYLIKGTGAGQATISYTYNPAVKWFSEIHAVTEDGNTIAMALKTFQSGQTGSAHFLRAQKDAVLSFEDYTGQGETFLREHRGDGSSYTHVGIYLRVDEIDSDGRTDVHVRSPSGESVLCIGRGGQGLTGGGDSQCDPIPPNAVDYEGGYLLQVPFEVGNWELDVDHSGLSAASITGEVRFVSIFDLSGRV